MNSTPALKADALKAAIAIIPCSREKAWDDVAITGPQPARLAYRSPLFMAALRWADAVAERTLILSALHGLVDADDLIAERYDVTFSRPGDPVVSTQTLYRQARDFGLFAHENVICALPDDYVERLTVAFAGTRTRCTNVLAGIDLADLAAMRHAVEIALAAAQKGDEFDGDQGPA